MNMRERIQFTVRGRCDDKGRSQRDETRRQDEKFAKFKMSQYNLCLG